MAIPPFLLSFRASIMHEEASQQASVSAEMAREHLCLVRSRIHHSDNLMT